MDNIRQVCRKRRIRNNCDSLAQPFSLGISEINLLLIGEHVSSGSTLQKRQCWTRVCGPAVNRHKNNEPES